MEKEKFFLNYVIRTYIYLYAYEESKDLGTSI